MPAKKKKTGLSGLDRQISSTREKIKGVKAEKRAAETKARKEKQLEKLQNDLRKLNGKAPKKRRR